MNQTKTVRATKVHANTSVAVNLDTEVSEAVSYARDYLTSLPRRVREVEVAAENLLSSAG